MVHTGNQTTRELQVKIEGDSGDLESSLAEVRAGLQLVESGLKDVEDEAEEAGDELTGLSARASGAAGSLTALGGAATGASGGVSSLRSTMLTFKLTAGTLAFTTLPALSSAIVTVGTVAAGVGLGGAGVLGLGAAARGAEQLKEDLKIVRENIVETAAVVGERFGFGELVGEGIRAIDDVFAETLARVGPMLPQFADALADFGAAAADAIPVVTEELVQLGADALPAIRDLMTFIAREGPGAFQAMRDSFTEILPELRQFIGSVVRLAPVFLEFSTTVTDTVLPMLTTLTEFLRGAMQMFNSLPKPMQKVAAAAIVLGPLIGMSGLAGSFATLATKAAAAAGATGTALAVGLAALDKQQQAIDKKMEKETGMDLQTIMQFMFPTPGVPRGGGPEAGVAMTGQGQRRAQQIRKGVLSPPSSGQSEISKLLADLKAAMDETTKAVKDTAKNTGKTAMETGATKQTLQQSPLVGGARSRCDLREHLLGPFERAARPAGGAAGGGGGLSSMAPRSMAAGPNSGPVRFLDEAFDAQKVKDAVKDGVESADQSTAVMVNGERFGEVTRRTQDTVDGSITVE